MYDDDSYFEREETPLTPRQRQDVQREVLNTLAAYQQANLAIAQRTQGALQRAEKEHPGITAKWHSPEVAQRFLTDEQNKRLAERLGALQAGYGDDQDWDEHLRTFHQRTLDYETAPPAQPGQRSSRNDLSLQEINSLPLGQRRAAIEALKNRVGDMPLDEADPENARFKRERGSNS